ncbi:MAG: hypothetical protein HMLKMBBP_03207 [Planctomycetes bacterium]|nr:hypothetical protein [Planctomycetota bacterium]
MTHRSAARAVATALALATASPAAFADDRDAVIRELRDQLDRQAAAQAEMRRELDRLTGLSDPSRRAEEMRSALEAVIRENPGLTSGAIPDRAGGERGWRLSKPKSDFDVGGYFSTLYRDSEADGEHGSFVDNRLVLQGHAAVGRMVTFDTEVEWEHGGISDEVDGEIVVEYAELRFADSECFGIRAGTLLVPFGRFNFQHDDPLNELSSRPSVSRFVSGTTFSLPGIGVDGVLPFGDSATLNYDVILTNGLKDEITSEEGIREARGLFEDDDNHGKTLFGRVGFVPDTEGWLDALDLGASFAWGNVGDLGRGQDDLRGYAFDAAAKSGPWEFQGEWSHIGIDRDPAAPPPMDPTGALGPVRGIGGWYAQALHRFRGDWVRGLPFATESASVAVVLRRDQVDLNDRVRGASPQDDERAWTLGLNYRPTTKTVIKLEYRKAGSAAEGEAGDDRDLIALEFATYF